MESVGPLNRRRRAVWAEIVLVVDDEPETRAVTARTLREGGFYVLEADSGPAALSQLMTDAAGTALLVAEASMPGMSGEELAREVRSLRPGVSVLLMAGAADDEDQLLDAARLALESRPAA